MDKKVLIIAEAGVNHNGSLEIAKKLIDVAVDSGVDIVKFQTASLEALVSSTAKMSQYQINNVGKETSQKEMLSHLLLPYDNFYQLADYCKQKGIIFLSTPFDIESIDFLDNFDMPFWKIPSGEITNYPYLVKIAMTGKPIVLSTGMSTMAEILNAKELLKKNGAGHITLLHCNTDYPTNMKDVNLNAMQTLRQIEGVDIGYSDHTLGIEVPIAAVACGATIIEKHFTLDRTMHGPDHKCSLEPAELVNMVKAIRNIEIAMGDFCKQPTQSELKNIAVARKSIIASKSIIQGTLIDESCITTKRPGNGINPMEWYNILGKHANRNYRKDELLDRCILNEK